MTELNYEPLVISYENDLENNENSLFFKQTLEKNGWKYLFVGQGDKWNGFKTRIDKYYFTLQMLPMEQLVILSDARDVFCVRSPLAFNNSINKLTNIDDKIIISTELFLNGHIYWDNSEVEKIIANNIDFFWQGIPINNYFEYYNITCDTSHLRKYVNAGLIIGKVKNLIQAFEFIVDNNYTDDQLGFSNYCNTYPEKVFLDFNAEILHTSTFGVDGGLYEECQKLDAPSLSELLGLHSYFLHIPGLSISKGQKHIYNIIKYLLNSEFTSLNIMPNFYGIKLNDSLEYKYFNKK